MILGSNQTFINAELLVWSIILQNLIFMDYQGLDLGTGIVTPGFSRTHKVSVYQLNGKALG
jgi:hypothetical protein